MKEWKLVAAAGIFVALTCVKLLLPAASAAVRTKTLEALTYDADYIAVLDQIGGGLSLRSGETSEETAQPRMLAIPPRAQPLRYVVEEAATMGETEPIVPATVSAFLESQSAFAEYDLPENVDYSYTVLPFEFTVPVNGYNSSGFGYRLHPILNVVRFHYGTDFAANSGQGVLAFADGTVTFAGYDDSFGWHLKIDHGDGWVSHYCHCSKLFADTGQSVHRGDCIALIGMTGLATGPHLHFELTNGESYVNPEYYVNQ